MKKFGFWIALWIVGANAILEDLHIVKLKNNLNKNGNGTITAASFTEPSSFIRQHYALYQAKHQSFIGGGILKKMSLEDKELSINTIEVGKDFSAVVGSFDAQFTEYLHGLDAIDYVESNQIYRVAANIPLEKRDRQQSPVPSWGLARITHRDKSDLNVDIFDDSIQGEGVQVYVFDTGVNAEHPDLQGRVTRDISFINYEDDNDASGHGTHVAGIIGGTTFGVAKKAHIHSIKVLDKAGEGSTVALLEAIAFVGYNAIPGKSVINLSLTGPPSQSIDNALSSLARDRNIPVFVAAGNSGDDACAYTPSRNEAVFTVGATDRDDNVPGFSSFGKCVRLYAPGVDIMSSWLGIQSQSLSGTRILLTNYRWDIDDLLIFFSTIYSMANPHVTGIAALLLGKNNFASVEQIYDTLTLMATKNVLKMSSVAEGHENYNLLAYTGIEG
ncbi:peptidase S8/S53 domain-containing protein [Phascolomyces articulosus]|uniref:Peptidase S8/S53 domain-containing protein n=1 Tax=Phascolomyces articulosus TaxID=60185 RepID=A0AAD5K4T5_9FUNG|nr:peptidase S8/S53 domain-containing protein [Phascolomyces articulosus]